MARDRLRVVVTGLIAQHPRLGGVAWDYAQYADGLARLGHDVFYVEDSGEWAYTLDGGPSGDDWVARDPTPNVEHLAAVMDRIGLGGRWAYRFGLDGKWFGMDDAARADALRAADLLVNVSGSLEHPERYGERTRLAYVDTDPVFTQVRMRTDDAFRARVEAHDVFFTFGELGVTPETGIRWRPTRQPVVLDEWSNDVRPRDVFTTVMSWTSYRPLELEGARFGQKDVEFRRFLDLPRSFRPGALEVATTRTAHVDWSDRASGSPFDVLPPAGWRVVDAAEVCATPDRYRDYVVGSRGEWSVSKHGYVAGRSGWFSCRSACYLAAGRPVVVQDTGFADVLPTGEGLLAFSTPDEALEALREVDADPVRHGAAARDLATEHFDSDRVLTRLLEEAFADDGE